MTRPDQDARREMLQERQAKCDHHESLWGRCVFCGMTWEQQAAALDSSGDPAS